MHGTPHAGLAILSKVFPWRKLYCLSPWFYGERQTANQQLLKTGVVIGMSHFHLGRLTVIGFSAGIMG